MPQYAATLKHFKDGVKNWSVNAAVKNIEGWEEMLGKVETPAAKTVVKDLEKLKELLHAEKPDSGAINKLMAKLGKETVSMAKKSEGKDAEKAVELGEAMSEAASE